MSTSSSRLLVLPNRNTLGLGAVLGAMWYAGAGQNNGAAYLLCFTIASVAAVSALHAWANLRGMQLAAGPIAPVFAGEQMVVPVYAAGRKTARHASVAAWARGAETSFSFGDVGSEKTAFAELYIRTAERGCFDSLPVQLVSLYPLGFFTARLTFQLRQRHYVYPQPKGDLPLPVAFDPARETHEGARSEGDDFAGAREWRAGESMRHVDWKAVARGQGLLVKQWSGVAGDLLILDWTSLALAEEERLSQLCLWAITAEKSGATYGLRLPGTDIPPSRGAGHFHTCLRALAAFPATEERLENGGAA